MIPQLNPADVNATGAYQLAMALAMVSMGIGAILRFLPSRKWKAEGRDLMKSAFEAVLLGSSIMTVEFILGILREKIGYPDWPSLLKVVDNLANAGWITLQWVIPLAFIFGAVVGALDILSKIIPVIMTFVMHFFMAVAFSILAFFSSLAAILILFSNIIKVITAMAAHAYHVIALGIALFAWKHTRSLGISLLVFGIVLFYGLPVMLGFVKPAEPYVADPDEEARAKVLLALTENSVPTKISVVSAGGKPLYFSYVSMNSSVLVKDVPLNSTLIANNTGGPPRNERGNATFRFVYGRFYNESYPRASICIPAELFCIEMGPDYSKVKELRHQLYRNSTVQYVWYLGLLLPVRDNRVQVEGPSLAKPLFELPSDPIQIAASLRNVFGGLRSEDEYWEMVYGRSKPVRIDVPVVRELNQNVTAFVLYNETNYRSWREVEGRREYTHNYTIPRVSEHCWVSRTEEYFDETCNCTKTRYYYKARAEYVYETPSDDRFVLVLLPGTKVVPRVIWHSEFGGPAQGRSEPIIYLSSPSYPKEKGLILDYKPLTLKFNQGIIETQRISQETNEAANRIKGNPGTGSGTTRELEEPFQKEVTLNPEIEVWEIGIRHTRTIETGEQEGSCPSTPPYIEAWSWLGFNVENSEPWDPYKAGIFRWEEYSKTGEYEYRAPASLGSTPALGAYKPSDPRLVHRFYEEDPREPEANLSKYDAPLLMRFGEPISQLSYMLFALVVAFALADGVTGWLGGTSLGLAGFAMSMVGQMTGKMKLFSPIAIFRYPLFGRDMSKWAMKRLEDRIWKDAEQKLKEKAFETRRGWWKVKAAMEEAMNKADEEMIRKLKKKEQELKSTYWSLIEYHSISRELKRAQEKKSLMRAFGIWGIYNSLKHGDPERNLENLERRRLEILSRLLPDEAVMIRQLRDWRTEVKLSWWEARDVIRKIMRESKNERFWPGRFSKLRRAWFILTPLALLMHKEGRDTLFTALTGWPEAKVTKAWAQMAYDSPLAYRKLGIEWAKLGGKEVPVPEMKGQILGPGFTYEMEKRKYALVREELKPEELKMYVEERLDIMRKGAGQKRNEEELFYRDIFTAPVPPNAWWARQKGEEPPSPLDVLRKSDSLREVSTSDFIKALEGNAEKNLPFWNAIPVHRIDVKGGKPEVKYKDTYANFLIHYKDFHRDASKGQDGNKDENNKKDRFWFLWNEPKFEFTRAEAGEHVKIDGTLRENLSQRDLSDIGIDPREAMDEFRRYAKEKKTRGLGDDWAWFGKVTGGGVLDPDAMEELGVSEKKPEDRKPEIGEGKPESALDKVDSAGIEKVRESAGDSLKEAKSRSRTGELWGDNE